MKITFRKIENNYPYNLLLQADETREGIDTYLFDSEVWVAYVSQRDEPVGVMCLLPLDDDTVELMNIAVDESYRDKGIGGVMIEKAVEIAASQGYHEVILGTGTEDCAPDQIRFYERNGFHNSHLRENYFTEKYPDEPIFENGVQLRHMQVLARCIDLSKLSQIRQREAMRVIRDSGVEEAWKRVGATVNLIGSVKSGLIMKNLDIDLHVYTDEPMLEKSIAAMDLLQQNPSISHVRFNNLLDTEEACVEWHAQYKSVEGTIWQLDMIHIRRGSTYDGVMERVTEAIAKRLTPETRDAILRIKQDAPNDMPPRGIEVYYAVLEAGVRAYNEFADWKKTNPNINLMNWRP